MIFCQLFLIFSMSVYSRDTYLQSGKWIFLKFLTCCSSILYYRRVNRLGRQLAWKQRGKQDPRLLLASSRGSLPGCPLPTRPSKLRPPRPGLPALGGRGVPADRPVPACQLNEPRQLGDRQPPPAPRKRPRTRPPRRPGLVQPASRRLAPPGSRPQPVRSRPPPAGSRPLTAVNGPVWPAPAGRRPQPTCTRWTRLALASSMLSPAGSRLSTLSSRTTLDFLRPASPTSSSRPLTATTSSSSRRPPLLAGPEPRSRPCWSPRSSSPLVGLAVAAAVAPAGGCEPGLFRTLNTQQKLSHEITFLKICSWACFLR